jgi:hypothetical protein
MVYPSNKIEIHHSVAKSRGGGDEDWNLITLSIYEHAEEHALNYVLFDQAPLFDCRMKGWKLLPKDLQNAVLLKHSEQNISKKKEVKQKKKETFARNGTHNFQTLEGRERNRQKAIERNKKNNSLHNRSPVMIAATLANNAVRCCCLVCRKECSRPGMGRHFQTHRG